MTPISLAWWRNSPELPARSVCALLTAIVNIQGNCYDCLACRRRWRWIDGSADPVLGYEGEWGAREPKQIIGQNLTCVSMVKNAYGAYWQSASCSERLGFICKICTCILFEFVLSILLSSIRRFCKNSNYSRFRSFMLK